VKTRVDRRARHDRAEGTGEHTSPLYQTPHSQRSLHAGRSALDWLPQGGTRLGAAHARGDRPLSSKTGIAGAHACPDAHGQREHTYRWRTASGSTIRSRGGDRDGHRFQPGRIDVGGGSQGRLPAGDSVVETRRRSADSLACHRALPRRGALARMRIVLAPVRRSPSRSNDARECPLARGTSPLPHESGGETRDEDALLI